LCNALIHLNRHAEAETAARNALRLAPASVEVWQTLGAVLGEQWRLGEAIACFGKAISLKPDWPLPHCALGVSLERAGRIDEAADSLRTALRLHPQFPEAAAHLGGLLARQGRLDEAIPLLRTAVQLRPGDADTRIELARTLEASQRRWEAAEVLREGLKLAPDNTHVRFLIAAFSGQDAPPVMPPTLVRTLFDGYSENFDEHLEKLEYRAPQHLKAALDAVNTGQNLDILDLGCGTGLCGPLLRPRARTLAGIDLAPSMIRLAQKRGVYDRLDVGEIVAALRDRPAAYDLLVAADVLIYLGDVSDLFAAASIALRPNGLFAFSIEVSDTPGWVLRQSRRYAQHPEYIRQTAEAQGLEPIHHASISLRKEAGQDLPGMIIVLRKPRGEL
jgi:predicted TPR repeat methyltransferase